MILAKTDSSWLTEKMELSDEEQESIRKYKKAAARLPACSLLEYELPDFSATCAALDASYDSLQLYLQEAHPYARRLKKAAKLRQLHYLKFVKRQRTEEEGHRYWRKGLNILAADAEAKLAKWSQASEEQFADLIAKQGTYLDLSDELVEATETPEDLERLDPICVPAVSREEAKRRKKRRQRGRKHRREAEARFLSGVVTSLAPAADYEPPVLDGPSQSVRAILKLCEDSPDLFEHSPPFSPLLALEDPPSFSRWDCAVCVAMLAKMSEEVLAYASVRFLLLLLTRIDCFRVSFRYMIKKNGEQESKYPFIALCEDESKDTIVGMRIYADIFRVCYTCYGVRCWLHKRQPLNHRRLVQQKLRSLSASRPHFQRLNQLVPHAVQHVAAASAVLADTMGCLEPSSLLPSATLRPVHKIEKYMRLKMGLGNNELDLSVELTDDLIAEINKEIPAGEPKLTARRARRLQTWLRRKEESRLQHRPSYRRSRAVQFRRALRKPVSIHRLKHSQTVVSRGEVLFLLICFLSVVIGIFMYLPF